MTNQPNWKQIGTVGDINTSYGGGVIVVDQTGVYEPEIWYFEPSEPCNDWDREEKDIPGTIYGVTVDKTFSDEWYMKHNHLHSACESMGYDCDFVFGPDNHLALDLLCDLEGLARKTGVYLEVVDELEAFQDTFSKMGRFHFDKMIDPVERAQFIYDMCEYHGWEEFDTYPERDTTHGKFESRLKIRFQLGKDKEAQWKVVK